MKRLLYAVVLLFFAMLSIIMTAISGARALNTGPALIVAEKAAHRVAVLDPVAGITYDVAVPAFTQVGWAADGERFVLAVAADTESFVPVTDIHLHGLRGGEQILTQSEAADAALSWTPDGSRVVVETARDGNSDLYLIEDSGESRRLHTESGNRRMGPISPDGGRVAYLDGQTVMVTDLGTSETRELLTLAQSPALVWSPDGRTLAMSTFDGSGSRLILAPVDEQDPTAFIELTNMAHFPVWSPDSERIAFVIAEGFGGSSAIYAAGTGGGTPYLLADTPGRDVSPQWSPDGERLAFVSQSETGDTLYVVDALGTETRALASGAGQLSAPTWSPNGVWLTYVHTTSVSLSGSQGQIMSVRVADGATRRHTNTHGFVSLLGWWVS